MGRMSRDKGRKGERSVALEFERFGWTMRGLEGMGDHLAHRNVGRREATGLVVLHVECKRAERLRLPEWVAQAEAEAPEGVPPLLVYRSNGEPWRAVMRLEDILRLLG